MPATVPTHLSASLAMQFIQSQGWNWQEASDGQVQVENCYFCKKDGYHWYFATDGNRDGLHMCHHCGKSGNLRKLKEEMGLRVAGVDSRGEWAKGEKKIDALPDVEACHATLLGDADALDYLINTRGFTMEIIERQRLGLKEKHFFRVCGEVRALVIPYLVNGNCVYAKYRTLPPSPKDFNSPTGWEAPLYNGSYLTDGIHEITFVEGEADAIALMSNGVDTVCGVPGANMKKAEWIEALDRIAPEKVFILYDNDKVGMKAAQQLASRIGYDKCLRLVLPAFTVTVQESDCKLCGEDGKVVAGKLMGHDCDHKRQGKDVNEWFTLGGGSKEAFELLKEHAALFDVTGVTGPSDALDELEAELDKKTSLAPTYQPPWKPLANLVGWEDGDVIDIVAPEKIGKTTFGMNIMEHVVDQYNEDGLIVCLEMSQARLARKWVCMVTGTDDSIPKTDEESVRKLAELKAAIVTARARAANRTADLYFAYPQIKEPEDVYKLIRDCVRRYGVKWVMFDNIQLLCDNTLKNPAHRTIHLSQISKQFAKLAKDYGIKLIRILQPKRISQGNIVTTDDIDGSSQIAKDCDCAITLHRARVGEIKKAEWENSGYMETEQSFDPKMLVTVGLSRYSCGGSCTLEFDGKTSQVREFNTAVQSRMVAAAPAAQDPYALPTEKVLGRARAAEFLAGPPVELKPDMPAVPDEIII